MVKRRKKSKLTTQAFRMNKEQIKGLDRLARKEDRYISELIREAIDLYLLSKEQK